MREGKPGHDISSLSQAEREKRAKREIAMLAEARKMSKKDQFGEGTKPGLEAVQAQLETAEPVEFSDNEVTKVFDRKKSKNAKKSEADRNMADIVREIKKPKTAGDLMREIKQEMEAEPSQETKDAQVTMKKSLRESRKEGALGKGSRDVQDSLAEIRHVSETSEALKTVKELSSTHNDPDVIFERIAGHVEDGLKKARKEVVRAAKPKSEGLNLREFQTSPQLEAEQAQAAYAKAYTEYDPKFRAKISRGNKPKDAMANYDLIAAVRPPRLAFLTAKGRELNRLYQNMREKFAAVGNLHEQRVEKRQVEAVEEEKEWEDREWEARRRAAKE